jgi:FkbM family methyltransferase
VSDKGSAVPRSLRQALIALRGTGLELFRRGDLWPHKRSAARLLWDAHVERWSSGAETVARVGAVQCRLRPQDWFALRDVIIEGEYDPAIEMLPPDARVIDVGANVGFFGARVLALRPDASVLSLEPSADSFQILAGNARANADGRWRALHAALWNVDGHVRVTDDRLSSARHVGASGAEVRAVSLRTLLADVPAPDLLKLDIEGAEGEVITETTEPLFEPVRRLAIELHPSACDTAAVVRVIRRAFRQVWTVDGRDSAKPLLVAAKNPPGLPPARLRPLR